MSEGDFTLFFFLLSVTLLIRMNFDFWKVMKILVHFIVISASLQNPVRCSHQQRKCTECNLYSVFDMFSFLFSVMWNSTLEHFVRAFAFAVIKFRLYWWWCFCFPLSIATFWNICAGRSSFEGGGGDGTACAPIRNSLVFYFDALKNWNACNLKLDLSVDVLLPLLMSKCTSIISMDWMNKNRVSVRRLEGYNLLYASDCWAYLSVASMLRSTTTSYFTSKIVIYCSFVAKHTNLLLLLLFTCAWQIFFFTFIVISSELSVMLIYAQWSEFDRFNMQWSTNILIQTRAMPMFYALYYTRN